MNEGIGSTLSSSEERLLRCFRYLLDHDGSGRLEVSTKILKRGQKEILIECGRTYRYVVDDPRRIQDWVGHPESSSGKDG